MAVSIRENDVKASNLIFLYVAVACLREVIWQTMGHISPYYPQWGVIAVFLFALAIYVGLGLRIRAGKRWAKVLFLLNSLLNFYFISLRPGTLSIDFILSLLCWSLHFWAFFLVARDLLRQPAAGNTKAVARPAD